MVEFEYRPYRKIVIHQIQKIPLEQLIYVSAIGVEDGGTCTPFYWTNGIIFQHQSIPYSDEMISESLKGIIHWSLLTYEYLEEYKEELEGPRRVKIPLIKTEDEIFIKMVEWIKNVYEKSGES